MFMQQKESSPYVQNNKVIQVQDLERESKNTVSFMCIKNSAHWCEDITRGLKNNTHVRYQKWTQLAFWQCKLIIYTSAKWESRLPKTKLSQNEISILQTFSIFKTR